MAINISEKATELLDGLYNGINDVPNYDCHKALEDDWNKDYALIGEAYSPYIFEDEAYFDHDRFYADFVEFVRGYFVDDPTIVIDFSCCRFGSNELEIYRKKVVND